MSTKSLDYPNLVLLNPSSTQASWHALAVCRTPGVRALGAARARVLHVRAHGSPRRTPGPCSPAEPHPALAHSPKPSKPPWRPTAPPSGVPWRHAGVGSRLCHGRRRPSHPRAPAAPWEQPELIRKPSARARRRHVALQPQYSGRRRSYPRPPRDRPRAPI